MTGEAHWLEPALVVFGGLGVFWLMHLAVRASDSLLVEWRHFTCPVRNLKVHAKLVEDLSTSRFCDVKKCSAWGAFGRPCEKKCLKNLNDGSLIAHA